LSRLTEAFSPVFLFDVRLKHDRSALLSTTVDIYFPSWIDIVSSETRAQLVLSRTRGEFELNARFRIEKLDDDTGKADCVVVVYVVRKIQLMYYYNTHVPPSVAAVLSNGGFYESSNLTVHIISTFRSPPSRLEWQNENWKKYISTFFACR